MKWKTSITNIKEGKELIRGEELEKLIKSRSFSEVIYLLWKGKMPNEKESKMLDALFVAAIDHGVGAPSATVARTVVSAGNSMHTALSAGILALGELHGGAIEGAAEFYFKNKNNRNIGDTVKEMKDKGERVPGYGHKVLEKDGRAETLFKVAKENDFFGEFCNLAVKIENEINKISSKKLPINIDGAMAAIILEMGFSPKFAKAFFMTGRVPGLLAHIFEEQTSGDGLKRISEEEITFVGETGK